MKSYKIEIRSAFAEWDRYNVYMTAVCFDSQNNTTDYVNTTRELSVSPATPATTATPAPTPATAPLTITTPPCDHADLYLYVVAREFPASDAIASSPPFPIEVLITENAGAPSAATTTSSPEGATPTKTTHEVNQWGGLSVKLEIK